MIIGTRPREEHEHYGACEGHTLQVLLSNAETGLAQAIVARDGRASTGAFAAFARARAALPSNLGARMAEANLRRERGDLAAAVVLYTYAGCLLIICGARADRAESRQVHRLLSARSRRTARDLGPAE